MIIDKKSNCSNNCGFKINMKHGIGIKRIKFTIGFIDSSNLWNNPAIVPTIRPIIIEIRMATKVLIKVRKKASYVEKVFNKSMSELNVSGIEGKIYWLLTKKEVRNQIKIIIPIPNHWYKNKYLSLCSFFVIAI